MDEEQALRFDCLGMAIDSGATNEDALDVAQDYYEYVKAGREGATVVGFPKTVPKQ